MSTNGRIQRIAKESIRSDCPPRETPTWRADVEFGRQHSAEIWDAIDQLRSGQICGQVADAVGSRVHLDPRNQAARYLASQADSVDQDESACSCSCVQCRDLENCSGCTYSAENCPDQKNCTGHGDDGDLEAEEDEDETEEAEQGEDEDLDDEDEPEREDEEEDDE